MLAETEFPENIKRSQLQPEADVLIHATRTSEPVTRVGIGPQTQLRGNHERWNALPDEMQKRMLEHIRAHYNDVRQKKKPYCWAHFKIQIEDEFKNTCEGKTEEEIQAMPGPRIPSLQTYCAVINNEEPVEQTKRRGGKRAAFRKQPWYWPLTHRTPIHADRAWEIGHIDHAQCHVRVRHEDGGDETGRPWLTTLYDAHTRLIPAIADLAPIPSPQIPS